MKYKISNTWNVNYGRVDDIKNWNFIFFSCGITDRMIQNKITGYIIFLNIEIDFEI
jgi:hypothetical protein